MILKIENLLLIYKCKLLNVIDGDTLDLNVDFGMGFSGNCRIRLVGIDAPEIFKVKKESPGFIKGQIAKFVVKQWFHGSGPVYYLHAEHRGLYGRWLGEIWRRPGENSLNDYLIDKCYKTKYAPHYSQEPLKNGWG